MESKYPHWYPEHDMECCDYPGKDMMCCDERRLSRKMSHDLKKINEITIRPIPEKDVTSLISISQW